MVCFSETKKRTRSSVRCICYWNSGGHGSRPRIREASGSRSVGLHCRYDFYDIYDFLEQCQTQTVVEVVKVVSRFRR